MYHLPGENCTATLASASGMNVAKTSAELMDHAKINHELSETLLQYKTKIFNGDLRSDPTYEQASPPRTD